MANQLAFLVPALWLSAACGQEPVEHLVPQDGGSTPDASVDYDAGPGIGPPHAAILCQTIAERITHCEPVPELPREGWAPCRALTFGTLHLDDPPCVRPLLVTNSTPDPERTEPLLIHSLDLTVAEQDSEETYRGEDVGFRVLDGTGAPLSHDFEEPLVVSASTGTVAGLLLYLEYNAVAYGSWLGDADVAGFTIETTDPLNPRVTVEILGGTAAPKIAVSPSGIQFSPANEATTQTATVTVSNEGNLPLSIEAIQIDADDPNLAVDPSGGFEIERYSSVDIYVRRTIAATSSSNALLILSDDPQHPIISIPIDFE